MKQLVIKDEPMWPGTVKTGWRCTFPDGQLDVMWGNSWNDDTVLASFLTEVRQKFGEIEVIDERGKQSAVEEV